MSFVAIFVAALSVSATPLDDRIKAFDEAQTQTETMVLELLKTGLSEHRAAEAYVMVADWLRRNPSESQQLLFQAGQAARFTGDFSEAFSFYRKLLKNKSVNSNLAAPAVPIAYRMLLNEMRDETAAYLFMREEGDRLRKYGAARQFDSWFLRKALERNDLQAVADRLAVIHGNAGDIAEFDAFMKDLFARLQSFEKRDEATVDALDELAKVARDPGFKLRWNWIKTVSDYNAEALKANIKREKPAEELLAEPLQAAQALVAADPIGGSAFVVKGWSQWNQGDTPTFFRFVHVHRDLKARVFVDALQRLSPEQAKRMFKAGAKGPRGRWVSVAGFISPANAKTLVPRFPMIFNAIDAPDVEIWHREMTLEEAKALAPHLVRSPHAQAALVRAYAAAGEKKIEPVLAAMAKSESWRFAGGGRTSAARSMVDTVWNSGLDRAGADHGKLVKQYDREFNARIGQLSNQVAEKADSKSRMAAFNKLHRELLGNPSTPSLLGLWDSLLKQAPQPDKQQILQKLVADFSSAPPASTDLKKHLLAQALGKIDFGNPYSKLSFGPGMAGGWDRWGHNNVRKACPELAAQLAKLLEQQMKAGTLSEPVFGMWLHCLNPGESKALFQELVKSPAYAKLDPAYHRLAAHNLLFGAAALTEKSPNDPHVISRELLALPEEATPQQVEAAFRAVMTRAAQAGEPVAVLALHKVAALAELKGETRRLVLSLFDDLAPLGNYPHQQGYEQLGVRLIKEFRERGRWGEIAPYSAGLWRTCHTLDDHRHHRVADALVSYAEAALEAGHPSAALSVARTGLSSGVKSLNPNDGHYNDTAKAKKRRGTLTQVAGKAGLAIGLFEIPVSETNPAYPLFRSNAEYVQGNVEAAWALYEANAEKLLEAGAAQDDGAALVRRLPTNYSFWLLDRNIEMGETERAEAIAKELTIWSRQDEGVFSLEQEGKLKLAFAELAFRKGALDSARALYRLVADAREFRGSAMYLDAALGSVTIDRINRNFGAAMTELDKLMRLRDPESRKRVYFAQAEVLMDQENYKEAFAAIQSVLRHDPNHADALLLQSKVQYEMRKLVEASQVMLGITRENKIIVPGETVKIDLHDPTLRISGLGADIEVDIWAKSGDKERVMLHQLGDDKERFRAEVPTALGPPVPKDKTLQILGEDEIRFGYSKRFRDKMDDLPPDPDTVIGVAADAYMALSAGAFPPREGERKLDITELGLSTAQQRLGTRAVRPGNPIYLRVVDADQSKTSKPDTLAVTLRTSSGDEIRRLQLTETGPYTGEFEAVVPTTGAQAMAFASESAPGRDPNMAISSKDYPGWQGAAGEKGKRRIFGVDLNDNVPLDNMHIGWDGDGGALTRFVLQTSMNGSAWTTRARYPADPAPWDGRPLLRSFPTYGRNHMPVSNPKGRDLPTEWSDKMELSSARAGISYVSHYVPSLAGMKPKLASGGHPGYSVLMQYRAVFYQPEAAVRRFKLTGYPQEGGHTIFLIDGRPAQEDSEDPFFIRRELKPGLHEIQIWRHEGRDKLEKHKPVLLCDVPGEDELQPCPDTMFDPGTFPAGVREKIAGPATITESADEVKGLDVAFAEGTRARLARLVILDFEGVAPVIKKVTLTDRDGRKLLPVKQDFMALRQNEQMEVLPGDTITASYEDPVPATPKRDNHSRRLTVAFNTATITASFLNYITTEEGRRLQLEQIRRFKFDDPIGIFIDDADMDSSPERDVIEFTVATGAGNEVKLKAVETDVHSGRFEGRVFPIAGQPERESDIQLTEGGSLTATYRDMENLDPGIPADRSITIGHAKYAEPELSGYTVTSEALPPPTPAKNTDKAEKAGSLKRKTGPETFFARCELIYNYVDEAKLKSTPLDSVAGATLHFDVVVPHLAFAGSSEIAAYVQTEAGRKMAKPADDEEPAAPPQAFDISVPGTLKLTGVLKRNSAAAPKGYSVGAGPRPPTNAPPLEEGRFAFSVPLLLGDKPARSFATKAADLLPASAKPDGLAVRAGDVIHVGYAYKDKQGGVNWKTASFKVGSHAFLSVMDKGYNELLTDAFVGEKIYVRVIAYGLDQTPDRDRTSVSLQATSGATTNYNLRETEAHSGVFKGVFTINYADEVLPEQLPPVELNGFPVRYGDDVKISYAASQDGSPRTWTVRVNKGADGLIEPFSKRYTGDEMAIKTSFTLAECFFELAKKHRELEQESLARREIAHARKLLAEAVASHRDDDMHAHAEYLLGNLAQEFADLAKNDESRLPMYQDALKRFSKIPMDFPDSIFAPKAQFKVGLVYEKMGEVENSVEEYVKLAYKYPQHELIPTVMLRLGSYFQKRGLVYKKQADPLREKEDIESKAEVLRLDELSYPEFISAAIIYGKLPERFPDNPLSGLAALASSQNYMRAHQYAKAIQGFEKTYENETYDGRDIRAQAMYWCGLSYERWAQTMSEGNWKGRGGSIREAYQIYRRITFDFPDSKWAKFARGRLTDPVFSRIIELEKQERERMLESLKEARKRGR